jgi:hypothetical protein
MNTILLYLISCSDYQINNKPDDPQDGSPAIEVQPESINFGQVVVGTTESRIVQISSVGEVTLNVSSISLTDGFNFTLTDASPVSLLPSESSEFVVSWQSEGYSDSDSIKIISNDPSNPEVIVTISGLAPDDTGTVDTGDTGAPISQPVAVCSVSPAEVEAIHGSADWIGSSSYDPSGVAIASYDWQLISAPFGSSDVIPSGGANRRGFVPNLAGEYVGQLIVTNSLGISSDPCFATLDAIPGGNLWIEMFWVHSGDDMDLHLVAPGGSIVSDLDCYYGNCTFGILDWGVRGSTIDNPILDLDDIPSTGPENINIESPSSGRYTVYVHDYPGSVYSGRNDVTVNIYVGGYLEWTDTRNIDSEGYYQPFCEINWSAGSGSVTSL